MACLMLSLVPDMSARSFWNVAASSLVCGAALAAKKLGTGGVAVAFFGDGASNQGTTMESLNLASVWNLPAIFVVENNGYAEATSSKYSVACDDAADRASAFNMPGVVVDGHDFFAVYEAAGEAVRRAREDSAPTLIEVKINRYYGHFEGDAQTYRGKDEVKILRETKDCLDKFRDKVTSASLLEKGELDAVDADVAQIIDDSVDRAKAADKPPVNELMTDVYISY